MNVSHISNVREREKQREKEREKERGRLRERGSGRASEAHKNSINTLMKHMAGTLPELPPQTHAIHIQRHSTHTHLLALIHTRMKRIRLVKFCTIRAHFLSCCAPVTFACMPSVCVCASVRMCLCLSKCVCVSGVCESI